MKRNNMITALALTIAIGVGGTVYAATATTNETKQRVGMGAISSVRGYDYMANVLKEKAGLTDEQIAEGLKAGKTVYDLAKEKGVTEADIKAALTAERTKAIDEAVAKGTIAKEAGETMKEALKNNMESCTGTCSQAGMQGQGQGQGRGQGQGQGIKGQGQGMGKGQGQGMGKGQGQGGGMMGTGQRAADCPVVNGTSTTP